MAAPVSFSRWFGPSGLYDCEFGQAVLGRQRRGQKPEQRDEGKAGWTAGGVMSGLSSSNPGRSTGG